MKGDAARGDPSRERVLGSSITESPRVRLESDWGEQPIAGLESGTEVGSYELIRELGRGGMGVVFAARDVKLGRRVAIKFMLERHREFLDRFLVEARAIARCNHENIIVIYEVDEYDGLPFMVLEFLQGKGLEEMIGGKPMPASRALVLIEPVVRALCHAHDMGIVHRDLKPANIFVTDSGTVKVLDFSIAKAFEEMTAPAPAVARGKNKRQRVPLRANMTAAGALIGTPMYMAPEQVRGMPVDGRADVWATGVVLFEMLTGTSPLGDGLDLVAVLDLVASAEPLIDVHTALPGVDRRLVDIIARCLTKSLDERYDSAHELLADLEALRSGVGQKLRAGECPYPGLVCFDEADAGRFFGRDADIRRAQTLLRDTPLLTVIGASGSGKSSFVRAGLIPALRDADVPWEPLLLRPGLDPMRRLATLVARLEAPGSKLDVEAEIELTRQRTDRLRAEPGYLGSTLRNHSEHSQRRVLLFIDQFEELYTLVEDPNERAAFASCLLGAADDEGSPVRVVLCMRSDFIDRAADTPALMDVMMRGLMFLPPLGSDELREALLQPAELAGYRFESPEMVDRIVSELERAAAALSLLQFAAVKLWQDRDVGSKQLTVASYSAMGGIGGALAAHADHTFNEFSPAQQKLVRQVFQRLVTVESTRAICDVDELLDRADDRGAMQSVIDHLVSSRLVIIDAEAETPTLEVVHESLISSWPALRRWIDEDREDVAFLAQLRTAAKQWDDKGRPNGLLWRDEALDEARRWHQRAREQKITAREADFIDAVFELADRAHRRRRRVLVGAFAGVLAIAAGAIIAVVLIAGAESNARDQASKARAEAARARAAEADVKRQIQRVRAAQSRRKAAEDKANRESRRARAEADRAKLAADRADLADLELKKGKESLAEANNRLIRVVLRARRERDRAQKALQLAEEKAQSELRTKKAYLNRLLREKERQLRRLEAKMKRTCIDL